MISIIIPNYNQQDYLSDALDSTISQIKVVPYEVIVIDDGSTDNSLEIAKKYEKENPFLIKAVSQVNKGLASARNTGIMNAKFDWILPLDADDALQENAIQKSIEAIKKTDADIIGLSFKTFGTSNEQIILMPDPKLEDFRSGNRLGYCSVIRKSKLLEVGGYSPKMVEGYEDLHLWINLLSRGAKIITIPEVLWLYRTKEKSMWKDITPEIHEKLLTQINKDVPEAQLNF